MMTVADLEIRDPEEMEWVASPSGAPGCFSKKLFVYGPMNLGHGGSSAPYTTLYRFEPGASYPPWRVASGTCETLVVRGTLEINGMPIREGRWCRLPEGEAAWKLGSTLGCEVTTVVRGRIESVADGVAR